MFRVLYPASHDSGQTSPVPGRPVPLPACCCCNNSLVSGKTLHYGKHVGRGAVVCLHSTVTNCPAVFPVDRPSTVTHG